MIIKKIRNYIEKQGLNIVSQPLNKKVDGNEQDYIITEGLFKLGIRIIIRKAMLIISSQNTNYQESANKNWRRGLWIYKRTPQIGDSLMDLACRSIFKECNCTIDLLTTTNIEELFKSDSWFEIITSNVNEITNIKYDFIIIQSIHYRSLKDKIKYFKNKPWLCIQGYYDVPDFNRLKWGAQRIAELWNNNSTLNYNWHAKQKLNIKVEYERDIPFVIVLGGREECRTYKYWDEVLEHLKDEGLNCVTLIGEGQNANSDAIKILLKIKGIKIINLVNETSIHQCLHVLVRTKTILVADGGTMHMAVAMQVPNIISLFIKKIPPKLRLPNKYQDNAIISKTDNVNDITAHEITKKLISIINKKILLSDFID